MDLTNAQWAIVSPLIAAGIASASPHEVQTIDNGFLEDAPDRLIGDRAYDSDGLDERVREERGIELIAPHRPNRKRAVTQDGRPLRRCKRRWKVERLFGLDFLLCASECSEISTRL